MGSAAAGTFSKEERLCGKAAVSALVSGGKWGGTAHLRYCWLYRGDGQPSRKKALLGCDGVDFMLAWSSKECGDWQTVRDEVAAALTRIGKAARQRVSGQQNDSAR